jgi:RNA polymerase sigma factor (TIGR02999 family)
VERTRPLLRRRKSAQKRGGGRRDEELDAAFTVAAGDLGLDDVLAVDAALGALEAEHPRHAQVVVMRYFGGLTAEEVAEALGVTVRTVERDWRFARAYLHARLGGDLR